jgi:hypothetical protein
MKTALKRGAIIAASMLGGLAQIVVGTALASAEAIPPAIQAVSKPLSTSVLVGERGPHQRTWNKVLTWQDDQGRTVSQTNVAYVELESGMHYWEEGQWTETQELIESYPDGAIARQGPHKVILANNLNTVGAIDLQLPDGQRLRSHILGLSYFDGATGQSVLVAGVKDALGWLLPPNQVVYTNAFTNLNADVRYTYRKSGFSQDVILREQPPAPAEWGLNPATTRLQILTEFLEPPAPQVRVMTVNGADGLVDERLDFGSLKIGRGKAFSFGMENEAGRAVRVVKQWTVLEGRTFLVEEVPLMAIEPQLRVLPEKGSGVVESAACWPG